MAKKWEFYNEQEEKVKQISKKYHINELLAQIILNREIEGDESIQVFLNPTRKDFYNPFLFKDMDIAIKRIIEAIEKKESVIIYGDYDVDGITSTTVLRKFLEERGLTVDTYIPNRLDEGYGLNCNAIDEISKRGHSLIITVDCGISGIEEIAYANSLGIETIITDHHEAGENLPEAIAVIDAKRKDNTYPFRGLAGVGVVFKVIQAISIQLGLEEKEFLKYLDLVCVGTISDIVPLVDENRVIAKLGLKLIQVTKNPGLKSLMQITGYNKVDSNSVSFGIAPRINACGRMGHEEQALKLFLTKQKEEAEIITKQLNEYNTLRQEIEKRIYEEAIQKIESNRMKEMSSIVIAGENWHHGVIGIVSSKVTDIYFKPSILLCIEGEIAKGSGRSIPGFDLHEALGKCSDLLEKYGGHEMAVGLTLKKENLEAFEKRFEEVAKSQKVNEIAPVLWIDSEITLKDMNIPMVKELEKLEPFGEGNKLPLFLYRNLKIDSIRALSEGKHLKLTLKDTNYIINAIGFNLGYLAEEYRIGDKIDVVGTLEINSFNNIESVQINIKDVMKSL